MPDVVIGTTRIPYRVEGAGSALVLVHGTGAGAQMWEPLLPALAEQHTVIVPDLSGSAAVDDDGDLTVEQLADQVVGVIEDSGVGRAHVLGFSLGAPVALAVAATRADLVDRLMAVAGWVHSDGDEYLRLMMTTWRALGEVSSTDFGRFATLTAFSRDHLQSIGRDAVEGNTTYMQPTPGTNRQIDLGLRVDIRHLLPRITTTTLVVGCGRDATVPVENSRALHAALPDSSYAELDTGHVAVFERPGEFTELVTGFLR